MLKRILRSPHGYFRFINIPFANEVCRRFSDSIKGSPSVNLHGDAHLEQYAVTGEGRGLADFDDSASGPALLDLVRFGVSLELATRSAGLDLPKHAALDEFLRGYRDALKNPDLEVPEPAIVAKIRAHFPEGREGFFTWVDSIGGQVDQAEQERLMEALKPYVDAVTEDQAELDPAYFAVKSLSHPKIGIGSALDRKFLIRIEGPTDSDDDDEVLELKQVRDLSAVSCLSGRAKDDPFRILVAQARISYAPYRLLGYLRHDGVYFWVHAWAPAYQELDVLELKNPKDLLEVAYDVGVQLGRGHPKHIAAPLGAQLRRELRRAVRAQRDRLAKNIDELATEVVSAWKQFKAERAEP